MTEQKEENNTEASVKEVLEQKGAVYQASAEKAEDNKSSAYTLLLVGGIGLIFIILCMAGIIDWNINSSSRYMIYGVMSALFILFIVMGMVSMHSYRFFKEKAQKEDNLTVEIKSWCLSTMTADSIDEVLEEEFDSEEIKYFKRTEEMKHRITDKFLNLDEAYVEHFIDMVYPEIFEQTK